MKSLRDPLFLIILIASLVLGSLSLDRGHDWGDDFASYIMQAKSIWNGTTQEFVEHNRFTINESSFIIGPVAYPWGYPLLLTPAYALRGVKALPLKLPGFFLFLGFLVCLYWMTKDRLLRTERLLFVALFAFNPLLLGFLNQLLSDIPFLFFSTVSLWLMVKEGRYKTVNSVILGAVIACAFFVRTQGLLLLASYGVVELFSLWENRFSREMMKRIVWNMFLVCASFGVLWLLYAVAFPGGGESYLAQYKDFKASQILPRTKDYFQLFSNFFGEGSIWKFFYYVTFAFFLLGLWTRRKQEMAFIVFFILWMLSLVTWPAWQGPRFIFPLLPLFLYFVFQGTRTLLQWLPETNRVWGQWILTATWLGVIGIFLFQSGAHAYENLKLNRAADNAFETYSQDMFEFIRENTSSESVIVFFKPRAMRLFTDRDAYMAQTCSELTRGNYVVINKVAENSQVPEDEVDECGIPMRDVFENKRYLVFQILQ
jgi:4-amino-4-deoxy-L-arabinose transferase-like glycosyltransferase